MRANKKLSNQRHINRFPTKTEPFKGMKSIQNQHSSSTSLIPKFDGVNQFSCTQHRTNSHYENMLQEENQCKNSPTDSNLASYSNDLNEFCQKTCSGYEH